MVQNAYRYVVTSIDSEKLLNDLKNRFRVVSQRPSKEKPEKGLEAGTTLTLQIIEDTSEPVIDKKTGMVKDNNVLETFEATIAGKPYPMQLHKGDIVALDGFMKDVSYYIDFSLILRFSDVKLLKPVTAQAQQQGSVNNATTGQAK